MERVDIVNEELLGCFNPALKNQKAPKNMPQLFHLFLLMAESSSIIAILFFIQITITRI